MRRHEVAQQAELGEWSSGAACYLLGEEFDVGGGGTVGSRVREEEWRVLDLEWWGPRGRSWSCGPSGAVLRATRCWWSCGCVEMFAGEEFLERGKVCWREF